MTSRSKREHVLRQDALIQDLQNEGRAALYRFADEQVNVIGHDDEPARTKP
jgi:hypothetical protein